MVSRPQGLPLLQPGFTHAVLKHSADDSFLGLVVGLHSWPINCCVTGGSSAWVLSMGSQCIGPMSTSQEAQQLPAQQAWSFLQGSGQVIGPSWTPSAFVYPDSMVKVKVSVQHPGDSFQHSRRPPVPGRGCQSRVQPAQVWLSFTLSASPKLETRGQKIKGHQTEPDTTLISRG